MISKLLEKAKDVKAAKLAHRNWRDYHPVIHELMFTKGWSNKQIAIWLVSEDQSLSDADIPRVQQAAAYYRFQSRKRNE